MQAITVRPAPPCAHVASHEEPEHDNTQRIYTLFVSKGERDLLARVLGKLTLHPDLLKEMLSPADAKAVHDLFLALPTR